MGRAGVENGKSGGVDSQHHRSNAANGTENSTLMYQDVCSRYVGGLQIARRLSTRTCAADDRVYEVVGERGMRIWVLVLRILWGAMIMTTIIGVFRTPRRNVWTYVFVAASAALHLSWLVNPFESVGEVWYSGSLRLLLKLVAQVVLGQSVLFGVMVWKQLVASIASRKQSNRCVVCILLILGVVVMPCEIAYSVGGAPLCFRWIGRATFLLYMLIIVPTGAYYTYWLYKCYATYARSGSNNKIDRLKQCWRWVAVIDCCGMAMVGSVVWDHVTKEQCFNTDEANVHKFVFETMIEIEAFVLACALLMSIRGSGLERIKASSESSSDFSEIRSLPVDDSLVRMADRALLRNVTLMEMAKDDGEVRSADRVRRMTLMEMANNQEEPRSVGPSTALPGQVRRMTLMEMARIAERDDERRPTILL